MQRYVYSFHFLTEACKELGVETGGLEKLMDGEEWNVEYGFPVRMEIITHARTQPEGKENSTQVIHFADMLLQYCELQDASGEDYGALRDRLMAENTQWIAKQEREAGCGASLCPAITAMWPGGAAMTLWASCWLDFKKASKSPELEKQITQYTYLGNLGEGYAWYMRLLPPSYRMFQPPAVVVRWDDICG